MAYKFETVDVFTADRFCGNPLAVFTDAAGMRTETMQALAAEMNLSETTFVLPPDDPSNTARVRIFNRTTEMPFAGHPMIGTAFLLARSGVGDGATMRLEVPAGLVAVELERDASNTIVGGTIVAPQPLSLGIHIPSAIVAACVGISPEDIVTDRHAPVLASVGNPYIVAQVTDAALSSCVPNLTAFRSAVAVYPQFNGRFSLHLYAGDGENLRARMFAPLAGTVEDPATGSANAPLGALLLSLGSADEARFTILQGVEMGRPSTLRVAAWRSDAGIVASVAGQCVPVFVGHVRLD
jgi:trans-2,3-dihydro-3-hydroxyanthranilate isomerase